MDEVRLTRVTDLSLVLEGREHVGASKELQVRLRAVAPHLFEEGLESNHEERCLTRTTRDRTAGYPSWTCRPAYARSAAARSRRSTGEGGYLHDSRTLDWLENRSLYGRVCRARAGPAGLVCARRGGECSP